MTLDEIASKMKRALEIETSYKNAESAESDLIESVFVLGNALVEAQTRLDLALEALRTVEWRGPGQGRLVCPLCHGGECHTSDCLVGRALGQRAL